MLVRSSKIKRKIPIQTYVGGILILIFLEHIGRITLEHIGAYWNIFEE